MNLLLKIIICPLIVLLTAYFLPNVNYANIYQPIGVGLILALVGYLMESMILRRGTFWVSNIMDFTASFIIVFGSQYVFRGAYITVTGALITALFLAVSEYLQHAAFVKSQGTQRRNMYKLFQKNRPEH